MIGSRHSPRRVGARGETVSRPGTDAAPFDLRSPTTSPGSRIPYLRLDLRFWASVLFGLVWAAFSVWLALPWIRDLGDALTVPLEVALGTT